MNPNNKKDAEPVINHLLFHKALAANEHYWARLDKYMDMVNELGKGAHIAIKDPFDRSIAITFELAIEHQLDPWDIDLVKFAREYLKRIRKEENIDLITAGRLIFMAWTVLKLQSDEVLSSAEDVGEDETGDRVEEEWEWGEQLGFPYFTGSETDFEYTTKLLNAPAPPLREMIWRKGKRRVTLVELVDAFEEAKREAESRKIYLERIRAERDESRARSRELVGSRVHKDRLEENMRLVWDRIRKFDGHAIPLSHIYEQDLEDMIMTIVASLFLAQKRMIDIWQEQFPYGEIYVRNLKVKVKAGRRKYKRTEETEIIIERRPIRYRQWT
jgi:segregation and condensation protein A